MTTQTMASAICGPAYRCQSPSSSIIRKPTFCTVSTSIISISNTRNLRLSTWINQLDLAPFSQWNGLRQLGVSISQHSGKSVKKGKCKGKGVFASLFGVGAPEALVIGVVALLVFGPKGLAEVARTLGKTLRAFQPTIRELQDVSKEFKSTLEREIGLDDIKSPTQNNSSSSTTNMNSSPSKIASSEDSQMKVESNGSPPTNKAYSSEEYLKITEEQLKAAAVQQQKQTAPIGENQSEPKTQTQDTSDTVQEDAPVVPPPQNPKSET